MELCLWSPYQEGGIVWNHKFVYMYLLNLYHYQPQKDIPLWYRVRWYSSTFQMNGICVELKWHHTVLSGKHVHYIAANEPSQIEQSVKSNCHIWNICEFSYTQHACMHVHMRVHTYSHSQESWCTRVVLCCLFLFFLWCNHTDLIMPLEDLLLTSSFCYKPQHNTTRHKPWVDCLIH